jgi:hypothetical protein
VEEEEEGAVEEVAEGIIEEVIGGQCNNISILFLTQQKTNITVLYTTKIYSATVLAFSCLFYAVIKYKINIYQLA